MNMIDGEFFANGLKKNDPKRLKSVSDVYALIDEVGFMPLMENGIAGFSIEERAASDFWFTGHEEDPWLWRQIIAQEQKIAYGKFFGKKAGFLSLKWLPVFANYRRKGYDFDSLYQDGKAHYKSKLVMDVLEEEKTIASNLLKEKAGFSKGLEKGFDTVLTNLQMQTYLINSGFTRKKNKQGEEYGWSVAVYAQPESLFGEKLVRSEYKNAPEDSLEKIMSHMRKLFPEADEKAILKEIK